MNIILCYDDKRFWTVGTYVKKILVQCPKINILEHARIPEDTGICRKEHNPDTDLILLIDSGTHFKMHHERNHFPTNCKIAFWISDLHRPDWAAHRLQMIREWHYDHVFYAQKDFKEMILNENYAPNEVTWLPHAADPYIFRPMPSIKKLYDIGYVGFLNEKRKRIADILSEYMNFKHFNSAWAWTAARCLNELRIGLNISVENDVCNMRAFETLSCGLPLLTNKIIGNGMEELFEDDMYLAFSDDKELRELAVRLIANSGVRETMGKRGREHVLKNHTYQHRVNTIFKTLGFESLDYYSK